MATISARPSPSAEAFARSAEAVAAAPVFLPYLSGERTPHNDAQATGLFAGLTAAHRQDALIYAVLEGVAFWFADGTDVLVEAGARPVTPLLVGGGARSGFWAQLISDATGLTIDVAAGAEAGAALGAARLGMLAAGAGDIDDGLRAARRRSASSPRARSSPSGCTPAATLSRAVWSRKSGALNASNSRRAA